MPSNKIDELRFESELALSTVLSVLFNLFYNTIFMWIWLWVVVVWVYFLLETVMAYLLQTI